MTVQTSRERLDRALGDYYSLPCSSIVTKGKSIYDKLRTRKKPGSDKTYSVATHRNTLSVLRRFGNYIVDEGWVNRNPFKGVKPVGKPKRGKPQLRVDESRKLVETCLNELAGGDANAIMAILAILLGPRASEIANLECRDVDDNGRLIWVATGETDEKQGKTRAARRFIEVPVMLRATLVRLSRDADGKTRDGLLVPKANRYKVHWHVKRLCRLAGVPVVSPQGLRGTHSTLATSAGATGELVMAALGQASTEVGRLHYIDQDVARATKGRKVTDLLTGIAPPKGEPS